jgi:hypothetical protein
MNLKKNPDVINAYEEALLQNDIKSRLEAGWTEDEVVSMVRWTEYFDNVTDEAKCLARMAKIDAEVKARLKESK